MVQLGYQTHQYNGYGPMTAPVTAHAGDSFELKPQVAQINPLSGKNAEQLEWTETREDLPHLLRQQGVQLYMWQETFDSVVQMTQTKLDISRCALKMFCIPFVGCCVMPCVMAKKSTDLINEWDEMVHFESKKYKPYGIKITIARDFVTQGAGSHRHLASVEVGLQFTVVKPQMTAQQQQQNDIDYSSSTPYTTSGTDSPYVATPVSPNLASELSKLNDLFQAGILSKTEFEAAKQRLITQ